MPAWWTLFAPDPNEDVDRTNAWLYEASRDKTWQRVYDEWKSQFMHYLEVVGSVPEQDFLTPGRYTWMGKFALADSSRGSLDHHMEHYETLIAWLRTHSEMQPGG